jgi:8-oxo-dGTP diphosphatase
MAFDDKFRLSSHAVILNSVGEVLLLKADYGSKSWGLPGGALVPGDGTTCHRIKRSYVIN